MNRYEFSPEAEADVNAIFDHLSEYHLRSAEKFLDQLEQTLLFLADNPRVGADQTLLAPELRVFPIQRYVVFFRPAKFGVEIVRVIHGSRDYRSLFQE